MYEPLSVEERQTLVRYLKGLSENLDNVVQLLQKRRAGSPSFLEMATAAQMNIDFMHSQMVNLGNEKLATEGSKLLLVVPRKANGAA